MDILHTLIAKVTFAVTIAGLMTFVEALPTSIRSINYTLLPGYILTYY